MSKPCRLALLPLLVAASLTLAVPAANASNLLVNGSFETPSIAGASYVFYATGSTAITGWTAVGPGETQLTRTEFLPAADGMQWVDLTGNIGYDKGLLSDAVVTTPGQLYTLSFDLGDYQLAGFQDSTVAVRINGGAATLFNNVYQSGVMDWERRSMSWLADASTAQISIIGVQNGSLSNAYGIGLDNVVFELAPVPEPGTYVLMLAGVAAIGLLRRPQCRTDASAGAGANAGMAG